MSVIPFVPAFRDSGGGIYSGNAGISIDVMEAATRSGYGFIGSTTVQTVNSSNLMASMIANPIGSGRNVHIILREFGCNVTTGVLEYQAYSNPTYTLNQNGAVANLRPGSPISPVAAMTWQIGTSFTPGGTAASGGFFPDTGGYREARYLGILTPGVSLTYLVQGNGGGSLQNQARIVMSYLWYEEPI